MQTLPAELHSRIFVECLPPGRYLKPTPGEAPLLLMRVCRRWRNIALRTPDLWCSLDTTTKDDFSVHGLKSVCAVDTDYYSRWLYRAGARPLSLAVVLGDDPLSQDEWMEDLHSFRRRFKSLRIVAFSGLELDELLEGCTLLKHLAIEGRYEPDGGSLTIAHPHPSLRTLSLDSIAATPSSFPRTSWASLVRLAVKLPEGTVCNADVLATLLDYCPRVYSLIFGPISLASIPRASSIHPNLRTVSIVFDDAFDFEDSQNPLFVLPNVSLLEVLLAFDRPLDDVVASHERHDLLAPQGPMLGSIAERDLTLKLSHKAKTVELFDLHWASVTHLYLKVSGNEDLWGDILTRCPHLQDLTIVGSPCTTRLTSLCDPLIHDKVESLYVETSVELGNLLCAATFPALRELTIHSPYYGEPEDVLGFLGRSKCPLEVLWISRGFSSNWTSEERANLESLVPSLHRERVTI